LTWAGDVQHVLVADALDGEGQRRLAVDRAEHGLFGKAVAYRGDIADANAGAVVAADQRELFELPAVIGLGHGTQGDRPPSVRSRPPGRSRERAWIAVTMLVKAQAVEPHLVVGQLDGNLVLALTLNGDLADVAQRENSSRICSLSSLSLRPRYRRTG
jgi:hypothetical protein